MDALSNPAGTDYVQPGVCDCLPLLAGIGVHDSTELHQSPADQYLGKDICGALQTGPGAALPDVKTHHSIFILDTWQYQRKFASDVYTIPMNQSSQPDRLNLETLAEGVNFLCIIDPALARIHANLGIPPLWAREPGFPTLVHIILEQQVSLASAKAAFVKLQQAAGAVTPETFLKYNDDELKGFGFSRQKTTYCRGLARLVLNNELDLEGLALLDDISARSTLVNIKGIGPWTANIYLLMALLRPDIWPSGDLALAVAYQKLIGLESRPTTEQLAEIAALWHPWRAVAARQLWHYYLSGMPTW
jgi:DNA-3-methyladenine glycosylase II